jgi:predicted DNA-binding ArsR family transcriptional regulator
MNCLPVRRFKRAGQCLYSTFFIIYLSQTVEQQLQGRGRDSNTERSQWESETQEDYQPSDAELEEHRAAERALEAAPRLIPSYPPPTLSDTLPPMEEISAYFHWYPSTGEQGSEVFWGFLGLFRVAKCRKCRQTVHKIVKVLANCISECQSFGKQSVEMSTFWQTVHRSVKNSANGRSKCQSFGKLSIKMLTHRQMVHRNGKVSANGPSKCQSFGTLFTEVSKSAGCALKEMDDICMSVFLCIPSLGSSLSKQNQHVPFMISYVEL